MAADPTASSLQGDARSGPMTPGRVARSSVACTSSQRIVAGPDARPASRSPQSIHPTRVIPRLVSRPPSNNSLAVIVRNVRG
jgi:hypothetical protein